MTLQERIAAGSKRIKLAPDEYRGPLVIDLPCDIDGSGCTVWCDRGPVITVRSPGVHLRNIRIEITGRNARQRALVCEAGDTILENVEVYGEVLGIGSDSGPAEVPRTIDLGIFAAESENSFVRELTLPSSARVRAGLGGLRVEPSQLTQGKTALRIITDKLRAGTSVYGEIFLDSGITRRIYVRGRAESGAPQVREITKPAAITVNPRGAPEALVCRHSTGNARKLQKGERLDIPTKRMEIRLLGAADRDIDCYVFCLNGQDQVRCDDDFVFFKQPVSVDGAVRTLLEGQDPGVEVALSCVDTGVERIVVSFSSYEAVREWPADSKVLIRVDGAEFVYSVDAPGALRTLIAVRLYRRGNSWRLWNTDQRSRSGIERLCEEHGVETE